MQTQQKLLLIILDGFGLGQNPSSDAIAQAKKPFINKLLNTSPWIPISASGEDVGLPAGQMGNSEVGHMNIGAGRIVYQEVTRIDRSIRSGEFFSIGAFLNSIENVKKNKSALHLIGLLSDGGVHSMNTHLYALIELAKRNGLSDLYVHALLDGRDTPPESGLIYLKQLEEKIKEIGLGEIATVMGRFYGMDRDNRWERTEKAYLAIAEGIGINAAYPLNAVASSYERQVTDEFVMPIVIKKDEIPVRKIQNNDSVIFYNFRSDRARQLTRAFIDDNFGKFNRKKLNLFFTTMTQYNEDFNCPAAFPPQLLTRTLGEVVSELNLRQFRLAETEKYAHVTFFFNGGREEPFPGEDRALIPSPRDVATYDQKPEMSAFEVTKKAVEILNLKSHDLIVMNYANCDMVGHSGIMDAAIKAVETVDLCLSRVVPEAVKNNYLVIITADHGNADKMIDDDGQPFTAHTTNMVPFIVSYGTKYNLKDSGKLADIAPTILRLMGINQPEEMTGESLL